MAHVGAFAGGVDEEGVPMMCRCRATSSGDCFEEALWLSSTCICLLSPKVDTHRVTQVHTCRVTHEQSDT